jgi:hypothetical protein
MLSPQRSGSVTLLPLDAHLGKTSHEVRLGICVPTENVIRSVLSVYSRVNENATLQKYLEIIVDALATDKMLALTRATNGNVVLWHGLHVKNLKNVLDGNAWQNIWRALRNMSGGDLEQHWIPQTVEVILQTAMPGIPSTNIIPAIRKITPKGENFEDWSGAGLIDKLATLQNPSIDRRSELEKFRAINSFLETVTNKPEAQIEIPHDRAHILVHMDSKVLPLDSLGTGVHDVIMLAAFCTIIESQIICIEEPEQHLHPLLQKRLIEYLEKNTSNQYFIATHSAAIIDSANAAVFHVTNHENETKISPAITVSERFNVLRDLGYKASDILQTNFVIWVEGPSDRVYINHWIRGAAEELVEGIHYSIMFYGGRLLNHLSADTDEVDNMSVFIELKRLNQNFAVVIDSDKKSEHSSINMTKQRIEQEITSPRCMVWVTAGKEIENYVPEAIITQALKSTYKNFDRLITKGKYKTALHFFSLDGKRVTSIDKIKVAKKVCNQPANYSSLDLGEKISALVERIRTAN